MASTTVNDTSLIDKAIRTEVQRATGIAFDNLKKELIERLDREKDMIVGGVVLGVMKLVDYQTINDRLQITVRKIED